MSEWIDRNIQEPSKDLDTILVWGKCECPHVAFQNYHYWSHTECCFDDGGHFNGESIDFKYWQPIPLPPKE